MSNRPFKNKNTHIVCGACGTALLAGDWYEHNETCPALDELEEGDEPEYTKGVEEELLENL